MGRRSVSGPASFVRGLVERESPTHAPQADQARSDFASLLNELTSQQILCKYL
jgi:hypothetical protein